MKMIIKITALAVAMIFVLGMVVEAKERVRSNMNLAKGSIFEYKFLDGNRINSTKSSDGPYADYRRTNNSGLEWPRGSGKTAVFTAGIWLAGIHRPTGAIRMSNMDYATEYQPGAFEPGEIFNTTTNNDAVWVARGNDPKWRLYKINKRDTSGTTGNIDYAEWPRAYGAPWDTVNNRPKFYGDQQIWMAINDVNRARHANISTTQPLGVEIQVLYFVFNQVGPLGDMMFLRWRIINKSDADYDSVFIGMHSDPDLGEANDDLPGVDTLLSLGYIYNGDNNDAGTSGYGARPPACGWDFFQGPWVTSPGDSAHYDGRWIRGRRNLPATSFVVYTNATFPQIIDPPDASPTYAPIAYDYLNGKAGTIRQFITKSDGSIYKFFFSGDPVANTGDLPANFPLGNFAPQDVRIMINSGPFTLAKNDTQEVVGAWMIAQGSDRLNSVTVLKQINSVAQQAFDDNFVVPSAPPLPVVKISELANNIVLEWSTNSSVTESYFFRGYKFQGYNLYQVADPVNAKATAKRIFTYDIVDGIKVIDDYVTEPTTGASYLLPVAFGDDSGLRYYFVIDKDHLQNEPLINGKKYFFAFTTYAYNTNSPAIPPLVIESPIEVLAGQQGRNYLTTIQPAIGSEIPVTVGQNLIPTNRKDDDNVLLQVISPLQLNNATYTVSFNGSGTTVNSWNLIKGADTLVKASTDFTGSVTRTVTDGFIPKVKNPVEGLRRDDQSPKGWAYTPAPNKWFGTAGMLGMNAMEASAIYPTGGQAPYNLAGGKTTVKPDQLKKVEIRFGETQKAYRYVSGLWVNAFTRRPLRHASFRPFIMDSTGRNGSQAIFQDYTDIPFTVWEVDENDGNSAARQLNVAFVERNDSLYDFQGNYLGLGLIDGKYEPNHKTAGGNELLIILSSDYAADTLGRYTKNPLNPAQKIDILGFNRDSLDMYYMIAIRKSDSTRTFRNGDRLVLTPNYRLNASYTYSFTTQKATGGNQELAKTELEKINVFPNPYFAHNRGEQTPLQRFVTFTHLPGTAKIRIFTLNGQLVKTIRHDDATTSLRTTARWDLRNENGLPVSSGMYIVHIEIEGVGNRVLKLAVVQPEERISRI